MGASRLGKSIALRKGEDREGGTDQSGNDEGGWQARHKHSYVVENCDGEAGKVHVE